MDSVLGQVPLEETEADLHAGSLLRSALRNICKGVREAGMERK